MRLALFCLENIRAPLAKVGEMNETDGLFLEHLLRGDALAGKGPWGGCVTLLSFCHFGL